MLLGRPPRRLGAHALPAVLDGLHHSGGRGARARAARRGRVQLRADGGADRDGGGRLQPDDWPHPLQSRHHRRGRGARHGHRRHGRWQGRRCARATLGTAGATLSAHRGSALGRRRRGLGLEAERARLEARTLRPRVHARVGSRRFRLDEPPPPPLACCQAHSPRNGAFARHAAARCALDCRGGGGRDCFCRRRAALGALPTRRVRRGHRDAA
mmetsp:Transcript_36258/g.95595  ORF Transcript_36258/g.95595 Transcript_36258/m.95595 type:complete len:213 (+) Transcript_36258:576-1214(+)